MSVPDTHEESSITIEYALTRGEVARSFLRSVTSSPRARIVLAAYGLTAGLVVLIVRWLILRSITAVDLAYAALWALGLFPFLTFWIFIRAKISKRVLTVSPSGIWTRIGELEARIPWDKIRTVDAKSKFILIARTNGNAFFVPRRAFSSEDQRNEFISRVKGWSGAS